MKSFFVKLYEEHFNKPFEDASRLTLTEDGIYFYEGKDVYFAKDGKAIKKVLTSEAAIVKLEIIKGTVFAIDRDANVISLGMQEAVSEGDIALWNLVLKMLQSTTDRTFVESAIEKYAKESGCYTAPWYSSSQELIPMDKQSEDRLCYTGNFINFYKTNTLPVLDRTLEDLQREKDTQIELLSNLGVLRNEDVSKFNLLTLKEFLTYIRPATLLNALDYSKVNKLMMYLVRVISCTIDYKELGTRYANEYNWMTSLLRDVWKDNNFLSSAIFMYDMPDRKSVV